jgi:hypothetical protein
MKNLDLINWTIQEAERLNTERREASEVDGTTSIGKLFAALERESFGQESPKDDLAQSRTLSIRIAAGGPINLPACVQAVSSTSENSSIEAQIPELLKAMSSLHKAIVQPDFSTAQEDRDQAIALRWVLRDIKSERLKWLPVNQRDLRLLIIMGLVEMQDDHPVLTNAGVRAIA